MRLTNKVHECSGNIPPFICWDGYFSEDDLNRIKEYCEAQDLETAQITKETSINPLIDSSIRKSKVRFVNLENDNAWMFSRLFQIVDFLNTEYYRFNLIGFENFQYTVYDEEGSHYNYHSDLISLQNTALMRKLSFSLILSDPSEYEGGEFEIDVRGEYLKIDQLKGRIIVFPSWAIHRVTPIISGTRKSIVIWALGPRFV